MSWQLALTMAEIVWVVCASSWIVLEKRSPTATLAWVFGLALLPIIGVFAYLYLGPRRLERKRNRRLAAIAGVTEDCSVYFARAPDPERRRVAQLMRLGAYRGGMPASSARAVDIYTSGAETFAAIAQAIAGATHHVHCEYYIFEPDATGTRFRDALIERARAGVQVRLLVDALGSPRVRGAFLAPLLAAGAKFARFNRPGLGALLGRRWLNFRTHRKIVVVDGRIGFCGGINVHDDENLDVNGADAWRDTHIRIEGDAVRGLQRTFLEDWAFAAGKLPVAPDLFPPDESGPYAVQIVASGPDADALSIARVYFAAIACARERVWLTTPYFVPDDALLAALTTASGRGVDVHLLLSAKTDSRLVDAAGRSYYDGLLGAGVKIHAYGPPMVHAKTLVIDEEIAMVGTANFDSRSLRLNFEVMAVVYDAKVAARLAEIFRADVARAHEVRIRDVKGALPARLLEATARLLAPQL